MALNVAWRWKTPVVSVGNEQQTSMTQGLRDLGTGIAQMRDRRYQKQEQQRRNAIEDEDRTRRIDEEDRRKKVYGEAAELMRGRQATLENLRSQREQIVRQIQQLQTELGVQ